MIPLRSSGVLGLLLLLPILTSAAEEPPWKRFLQGEDDRKAQQLDNQIRNLEAAGKFTEAIKPAEEVLALRKKLQGEGHWEIANATRKVETLRRVADLPTESRNRLVEAHRLNVAVMDLAHGGRMANAEPLLRKASAIFEEVLGPRHPDTAKSYIVLAGTLIEQGKPRDAEPLARKALAIAQEVLGARHPRTSTGYQSLAASLRDQGRHQEAEPLLRTALAIVEEAHGPESFLAAQMYADLAHLTWPHEAEPLYRKALALWEKEQGPRHFLTAYGYHNLAVSLRNQGRLRDAEPLFRKALVLLEEALGPKHRATANCHFNLAKTLRQQGRLRDAEPLFRKALAIIEEVQGLRHTDTAVFCSGLAYNLLAQERPQDAEPLFRRALAISEEVLGPKHRKTADAYYGLARGLLPLGRFQEAETLLRKALAIHEDPLGPRNPDSTSAYNNLALLISFQGKHADAERYWHAAMRGANENRVRRAPTGFAQATTSGIQPALGLAVSRAIRGQPVDAWQAAEQGLARGLLDDLTASRASPDSPDELRRRHGLASRLDQLDRVLIPLLSAETLDEARRKQRDELLGQKAALRRESAQRVADRSDDEVWPLARIQQQLAPDTALLFWLDHGPATFPTFACVVRRTGLPTWARLPGHGPAGDWTDEDISLSQRLREALGRRAPEAAELARALNTQRLVPLEPHLASTRELPAVRRLIVIPIGSMAGIPVETLTDRYLVSYAPSGTIFARLTKDHRPLRDPSLLALGDPTFVSLSTTPPTLPEHGLLVTEVLPGGNGAKGGIRADDVLLSYAGTPLKVRTDLALKTEGDSIPVRIWRQGTTLDLRLAPGRLSVILDEKSAPVALKQRQDSATLLAGSRGAAAKPLPGTRREVNTLTALFPRERSEVLLGSEASEQRLDALAGRLKDFRILHFATHGQMDVVSPWHSALLVANDRLPNALEQSLKNQKVYTGQLTVEAVNEWKLDADLVVLSACETGQGKQAGGEGMLGFAQVLFKAGARSLVLSLWKVDDAATALLMTRFYENLLGKRDGLKAPLPKAEALAEAKKWLRELCRPEVEALAVKLNKGELRGTVDEAKRVVAANDDTEDRPYAHPFYWSAFILLGDPE